MSYFESALVITLLKAVYILWYLYYSNLAGTFTLFFSWYAGLEEVTYGKVLGILVSFAGAVCIALNDSENTNDDSTEHSTTGDIVALLAALGYGLYTTAIRYNVSNILVATFYI